MNRIFNIAAMSVFVLATSCADNNYDGKAAVRPLLYGNVVPYMEGVSDLRWSSSAQAGVYMLDAASGEELYSNVPHTASVSGNSIARMFTSQNWEMPKDGRAVDMVYYSPYSDSVVEEVLVVDIADASSLGEIDLCYGRVNGRSRSEYNVDFKIRHMMAALMFRVEAEFDSQPVEIDELELTLTNMPRTASLDLVSGTISANTDNLTSLSAFVDLFAASQAVAYVAPVSSTANMQVQATLPNYELTRVANLDTVVEKLEPSTLYLFTIKFTKVGFKITLDSSVSDWGTGGDNSVSVGTN